MQSKSNPYNQIKCSFICSNIEFVNGIFSDIYGNMTNKTSFPCSIIAVMVSPRWMQHIFSFI